MAFMINREAPQSGLANLLALKGRMGDTELVHMTKPEVAALQATGQLTINPSTGLPEAFKLKDILPSLVAAGASVASGGTLTPLMSALVAGGTSLAVNKGDMGKAAMDALMSFGGAKLGAMLGGAGAEAGKIAGETAAQTAGQTATQAAGQAATTGGADLAVSGLGDLAGAEAGKAAGQYGIGSAAQAASTETLGGAGLDALSQRVGTLGADLAKAGAYEPSLLTKAGQFAGMEKALVPEVVEKSFVTGEALKPFSKEAAIKAGIQSALPVGTALATSSKVDQPEPEMMTVVDKDAVIQKQFVGKPTLTEQDIKDAFIQQSGKQISPLQFYQYTTTPATYKQVPRFNEGGDMENAADYNGAGMFSGMVKDSGRGDGMSDNVLFKIAGGGRTMPDKAALSPDEYVIDAYTVAALGNGSSDAGARVLDEFREEVRKKAYGSKKQPKQINGDKIASSYA